VALAARIVLPPLQIAEGLAVGARVGIPLTVTDTLPVAEQELLLVTVTI
jgi:hypothetical protein